MLYKTLDMNGRDTKMRAKTKQQRLSQGGQRRRRHFNLFNSDFGVWAEEDELNPTQRDLDYKFGKWIV